MTVGSFCLSFAIALAFTAALLLETAWAWTEHDGSPSHEKTNTFISKFLPLLSKGDECYSNLHAPFFCKKRWHSKATSHEPYISRNATKQLHDLNELIWGDHSDATEDKHALQIGTLHKQGEDHFIDTIFLVDQYGVLVALQEFGPGGMNSEKEHGSDHPVYIQVEAPHRKKGTVSCCRLKRLFEMREGGMGEGGGDREPGRRKEGCCHVKQRLT